MMNYLNTYRRYACDINRINSEALSDARALVELTEDIYNHDLEWIANQVLDTEGHRHVIMLSGPSSSGKTTTSKKLSDAFLRHGIDVQLISMDDFYLGAEYVRKLPDGKPDFESVEALDIPLISVPTLDALAYNLCGSADIVCPMMDARRQQVYTGVYSFYGDQMETLVPQAPLAVEEKRIIFRQIIDYGAVE